MRINFAWIRMRIHFAWIRVRIHFAWIRVHIHFAWIRMRIHFCALMASDPGMKLSIHFDKMAPKSTQYCILREIVILKEKPNKLY